MMKAQTHKDIPATPMTEQFHDPPTFYQVEHIAIGMASPIDNIESLKSFFSNSLMLKIPRFSSLLVKHQNGRQYWRKTEVDMDKHFIVRRLLDHEEEQVEVESEDVVNEYIAELAYAQPMSTEKPLWEIHVLVDVRCLVLRIHHAIGDGCSLMSLIRAIGEASGDVQRRREKTMSDAKWRWNKNGGQKGNLMYVWNSMVFCTQAMAKGLLVKDKRTVLTDNKNKYVAYWPQKLATATFDLDDVNMVKKAIPNATINDVLCGIIWGGFMKYIDAQSSSEPKEGQQIRGLLMANMRRVSGLQEFSSSDESDLETWWGNRAGWFTLPIHYTKRIGDGLDYVRKVKYTLDKKKHSMEPRFMILLRNMILRLFGLKVMNYLFLKSARNYTFGFSNVVGPSEQISIADNHVVYLKFSASSSPTGILMHLLSYMKNLELQILVAEDIIHDPKFLASCLTETLQEMKGALA